MVTGVQYLQLSNDLAYGAAIGGALGLTGTGGSILAVPALVYLCCGASVAIGTKRTFAAAQQFVGYWTRADIEQPLLIHLN